MEIVVVLSFVLSAILNNLAAKKGGKKKAEIYAEDRTYFKILPVVLIGLYSYCFSIAKSGNSFTCINTFNNSSYMYYFSSIFI